jgi:hypothetical protein
MRPRKTSPCAFCVTLSALLAASAFGQGGSSETRYVGEITGTTSHVNVRSGPSTNFYRVLQMSAGDRVQVIGEDSGWIAIVPPPGCYSLISQHYVDVGAGGEGVVNGNAVRVRAGSDLDKHRYAVQRKLSKGAVVKIIGEAHEGFLKIAPPEGARLWIHGDYVARVPADRVGQQTHMPQVTRRSEESRSEQMQPQSTKPVAIPPAPSRITEVVTTQPVAKNPNPVKAVAPARTTSTTTPPAIAQASRIEPRHTLVPVEPAGTARQTSGAASGATRGTRISASRSAVNPQPVAFEPVTSEPVRVVASLGPDTDDDPAPAIVRSTVVNQASQSTPVVQSRKVFSRLPETAVAPERGSSRRSQPIEMTPIEMTPVQYASATPVGGMRSRTPTRSPAYASSRAIAGNPAEPMESMVPVSPAVARSSTKPPQPTSAVKPQPTRHIANAAGSATTAIGPADSMSPTASMRATGQPRTEIIEYVSPQPGAGSIASNAKTTVQQIESRRIEPEVVAISPQRLTGNAEYIESAEFIRPVGADRSASRSEVSYGDASAGGATSPPSTTTYTYTPPANTSATAGTHHDSNPSGAARSHVDHAEMEIVNLSTTTTETSRTETPPAATWTPPATQTAQATRITRATQPPADDDFVAIIPPPAGAPVDPYPSATAAIRTGATADHGFSTSASTGAVATEIARSEDAAIESTYAQTAPAPEPDIVFTSDVPREQLEEVDAVFHAEMAKPVMDRRLERVARAYRGLIDGGHEAYVTAYAERRVAQVDLAIATVNAIRDIRAISQDVSRERKVALETRSSLRPQTRMVTRGFDAKGELRESMIYSSTPGLRRFRLVDPDMTVPRTLCYVEIPDTLRLDMEQYLGRVVGVRASKRFIETGDVDPINVVVADEIIVLDRGGANEQLLGARTGAADSAMIAVR